MVYLRSADSRLLKSFDPGKIQVLNRLSITGVGGRKNFRKVLDMPLKVDMSLACDRMCLYLT